MDTIPSPYGDDVPVARSVRSGRRIGPNPRVRRLTDRELQVARLVAQGLKDEAIGRALALSASTVRTYVRNIRQRLGLNGRAEIAVWVTSRLDPADPTGGLRRLDPTRETGSHPDIGTS